MLCMLRYRYECSRSRNFPPQRIGAIFEGASSMFDIARFICVNIRAQRTRSTTAEEDKLPYTGPHSRFRSRLTSHHCSHLNPPFFLCFIRAVIVARDTQHIERHLSSSPWQKRTKIDWRLWGITNMDRFVESVSRTFWPTRKSSFHPDPGSYLLRDRLAFVVWMLHYCACF